MIQDSTETTKKACTFPAISLRVYRAQLVDELKRLEDAGRRDSVQVDAIMETIMAIDKLYGEHQDIDDCTCWWTPAETAIAAGCL